MAKIPDPHRWFVLTTSDPSDSEEQLRRENLRRDGAGMPALQYLVPSQFLKRRASRGLQGDATSGDISSDPYGRQAVSRNNEIRSALRRYLFILGRESEIDLFLAGEWNTCHYNRIQFFRDGEGRRAAVPRRTMEEFIRMLADSRLSFELIPPIDDLRRGEPVRFRNSAFAGQTVYVVESRRTREGNVITVELDLVRDRLRMKVYDVRDEDVVRLDAGSSGPARNNDLIKRNQSQLLSILARRVNRKETEESRMDDALALNTMYAMRFRRFGANEAASYRRFLAQMLLCACLRHDAEGRAEYTGRVLAELEEVDRQGEAKAATDVRARMHAALFVATGDPAYRALARGYIREHDPKSDRLRMLVRLISKRNALRDI